jgi:hypothetical protein
MPNVRVGACNLPCIFALNVPDTLMKIREKSKGDSPSPRQWGDAKEQRRVRGMNLNVCEVGLSKRLAMQHSHAHAGFRVCRNNVPL